MSRSRSWRTREHVKSLQTKEIICAWNGLVRNRYIDSIVKKRDISSKKRESGIWGQKRYFLSNRQYRGFYANTNILFRSRSFSCTSSCSRCKASPPSVFTTTLRSSTARSQSRARSDRRFVATRSLGSCSAVAMRCSSPLCPTGR